MKTKKPVQKLEESCHCGCGCIGGCGVHDEPREVSSSDCNCSCHCHNGPCKSSHSHFCIHCTPEKPQSSCACGFVKHIDCEGNRKVNKSIEPTQDSWSKRFEENWERGGFFENGIVTKEILKKRFKGELQAERNRIKQIIKDYGDRSQNADLSTVEDILSELDSQDGDKK